MILVDIYIPSVDETFDFRVDETAKIKNVIQEVSEMLSKIYKNELNKDASEFIIFSYEKGKMLLGSQTLQKCGIKNGSKLLMV